MNDIMLLNSIRKVPGSNLGRTPTVPRLFFIFLQPTHANASTVFRIRERPVYLHNSSIQDIGGGGRSITINWFLLLVYGEFLLHLSVEGTNTQFTATYRTAHVNPPNPKLT